MLQARLIDPANPADVELLVAQRQACGWGEVLIPKMMGYVERGEIVYFLFSEAGTTDIVGSGAVDIGTGVYGDEMSSKETATFSVIGMFLWSRYRGKGYARQIAEFMIDYGFSFACPPQATVTAMTNARDKATNPLFTSLGFEEFFRGPKPEWNEPNSIGVHRRMSRDAWTARKSSVSTQSNTSITMTKPEFTYFMLSLETSDASTQVSDTDLLTWRQNITLALTKEHGLLGSSVHVDILHHESSSPDNSRQERVIIRVPRDDGKMAWNAISGWSNESKKMRMRVLKQSNYLTVIL